MPRKALVLLGVLALGLSGCIVAGVAAVGTGIIYVSGEAKKSYPASVETTYQATLKTMNTMGLTALDVNHVGNDYELRSRRPKDAAEVKVRIHRGGESLTEVGVRVGTWGEKDYSTEFLENVDKNLQ